MFTRTFTRRSFASFASSFKSCAIRRSERVHASSNRRFRGSTPPLSSSPLVSPVASSSDPVPKTLREFKVFVRTEWNSDRHRLMRMVLGSAAGGLIGAAYAGYVIAHDQMGSSNERHFVCVMCVLGGAAITGGIACTAGVSVPLLLLCGLAEGTGLVWHKIIEHERNFEQLRKQALLASPVIGSPITSQVISSNGEVIYEERSGSSNPKP